MATTSPTMHLGQREREEEEEEGGLVLKEDGGDDEQPGVFCVNDCTHFPHAFSSIELHVSNQ